MHGSTSYILATIFLFCISLLPPAYLRYYPFRPIATKKQCRILLAGHLAIFLLEFGILGTLFATETLPFKTGTFQGLYQFLYLPYVLLLMFTIRPYWFRHIFVLGLQSIYMLFIHTLTMEIFKLSWPENWYYDRWLPYFALYLLLFLIGMPFILRVFGRIFTREQLRQPKMAFWELSWPRAAATHVLSWQYGLLQSGPAAALSAGYSYLHAAEPQHARDCRHLPDYRHSERFSSD